MAGSGFNDVTSKGCSSIMHRLFEIPELVALSLPNKSDKKSLSVLARTCCALKEVALDALWADLDSVIPLLLLLRPLEVTKIDEVSYWAFSGGHLTSKDWNVYKKYCARVRSLTFITDGLSIRGATADDISPSVFHTMALTRPPDLHLMPMLQAYRISSPPEFHVHSLLFINPKVQRLQVDLTDDAGAETTRYILEEIVVRMTGLTELEITCPGILGTIEDQVVDCILGLRDLKKITLPHCYLTSRTLEALSWIPKLETIASVVGSEIPPQTPAPSLISTCRGTFQHLTTLSIATSLEVLAAMISDPDWAFELKALEVTARGMGDMDNARHFLDVLARSRPQMTSVTLDLFDPSSDPGAPSFETLLPLLSCREITFFSMRSRHPFVLEENELQQIFGSWPKLTHLSLCPDFVRTADAEPAPGVPWSSLYLFAEHCPNIQHLGLHFSRIAPEPQMGDYRLERLDSLRVGSSDIDDPCALAVFLTEVCSRRLEIRVGDLDIVPYTNGNKVSEDVQSRWTEVKNLFQRLTKMRERVVARNVDKIQALERRIKALRFGLGGAEETLKEDV